MREVYNQNEVLDFNTNDIDAMTDSIEVISCDKLSFFAFENEGAYDIEEIQVLGAALKVDKTASEFMAIPGSVLQGLGHKTIDISEFAFIKIAVKTVQGNLSVINLFVNPYRTI